MDTKPMKILIIEDDLEDCNNFIECAKTREDIEIVEITDSDIKGLRETKIKRPDGIVLDLELNNSATGNTDSLDFIKNLKKLNLNYEPIVIVTTHINSKRTYNILHRQGVDVILYKGQANYSANYVFNRFITYRETEPERTIEKLKEEMKDNKERISDFIDDELELIGITSKYVGREYIHDAIMHLIENDDGNSKHDDNVITIIANKYNKSNTTITNGMQNAIAHAWNSMPYEDLEQYYQGHIDLDRGMPTPMQLIYHYKKKAIKQI